MDIILPLECWKYRAEYFLHHDYVLKISLFSFFWYIKINTKYNKTKRQVYKDVCCYKNKLGDQGAYNLIEERNKRIGDYWTALPRRLWQIL